MQKQQHDFTHGNILKQLIVFSGPVMLTNLLQTSYQFTDSLWVGNLLGANALGAVAVSSTIVFTMLAFVIGLNNAALTILSQQKGRDSEDGLKRYLNAFVVMLIVLSVFLGAIGFLFADTLLQVLGTPDGIMSEAKDYLRINFLGILFLFGYNFISTVLRALGDSKTPLRFVFIAVILNIVLDPLFITGFHLGVQGAAYATIFSQGLAFVYGVTYVLRRKLAPFRIPTLPSRKEVTLILNLGIPAGLQMASVSGGVAAVMSVVTGFGEEVVGGFSAAQRLDNLIMLLAQALGTSVNSMAGQNIGVQNWSRVKRIAMYGVLYNLVIMIVVGLVVMSFAAFGIRLFIHEQNAVRFGTTYLQIVALCYPFLGINFVLNGIIRSSGAMYQVLVLNLISFWILRYPLTALGAGLFDEIGIAFGMGISLIISSLVSYLYYRYGKWQRKELFKARGNN